MSTPTDSNSDSDSDSAALLVTSPTCQSGTHLAQSSVISPAANRSTESRAAAALRAEIGCPAVSPAGLADTKSSRRHPLSQPHAGNEDWRSCPLRPSKLSSPRSVPRSSPLPHGPLHTPLRQSSDQQTVVACRRQTHGYLASCRSRNWFFICYLVLHTHMKLVF